MLHWALTFLLLAIFAGLLGFTNIAALSVEIAQLLFVVFLVLFLIAVTINALRGKTPPA